MFLYLNHNLLNSHNIPLKNIYKNTNCFHMTVQPFIITNLELITVTFPLTVCFINIHAKLVFLVAAHVGIAHEVQCVVVHTNNRCHKVKFHLRDENRAQVINSSHKTLLNTTQE